MQVFQLLEIKDSKTGRGFFTKYSISKGSVIFHFEGKLGSDSETSEMALQIGDNLFLQSPREGFLNYLNHSCEPNSYIDFMNLNLIALRDIKDGEEITLNYNTAEYDLVNSATPCSFVCHCASENCIKEIKGFKHQDSTRL